MKLYGLVGYPLGHSFSAGYFARKFREEGITGARYRNFPLRSIAELPKIMEENPELAGFNVTIPYKEAVIPYLSQLEGTAEAAGAVNCVKIEDSQSTGYNTDIPAFRSCLVELVGEDRPQALVLGSGGAARAACYVLEGMGIEYSIVSRKNTDGFFTFGEIDGETVGSHGLIINCTPLGTFPGIDGFPDIPYGAIGPEHFLFDMVYNPEETEFLRRGREAGAKTMNGLKMLERQADLSWQIWNDA